MTAPYLPRSSLLAYVGQEVRTGDLNREMR